MTPEERIEKNLMRVLSAGVSSSNIVITSLDDVDSMLKTMRDIMSESYIAGSDACHKATLDATICEWAQATLDATICEWAQDDEGNWGTSCGNLHSFIDDGPSENNHKFCPYCGGRLEVVS